MCSNTYEYQGIREKVNIHLTSSSLSSFFCLSKIHPPLYTALTSQRWLESFLSGLSVSSKNVFIAFSVGLIGVLVAAMKTMWQVWWFQTQLTLSFRFPQGKSSWFTRLLFFFCHFSKDSFSLWSWLLLLCFALFCFALVFNNFWGVTLGYRD